jgi:hypothetical protein
VRLYGGFALDLEAVIKSHIEPPYPLGLIAWD